MCNDLLVEKFHVELVLTVGSLPAGVLGEGECCCCWPVCDRSLFSNQPIGMADIIPNSKKCENSSTLFLLIRRNLAAKTTTKWWQTYHWAFLQIIIQRFLALCNDGSQKNNCTIIQYYVNRRLKIYGLSLININVFGSIIALQAKGETIAVIRKRNTI